MGVPVKRVHMPTSAVVQVKSSVGVPILLLLSAMVRTFVGGLDICV